MNDAFSTRVNIDHLGIKGDLFIPRNSEIIIIFVHGSGSNRFSVRNRFISRQLNENGLATLVVDLLSDREKEEDLLSRNLRFDIDLLTLRLTDITKWVMKYPLTNQFQIGYVSSSTGSAAALNVSGKYNHLKGMVSRGGRIDLSDPANLKKNYTPSLFVIGSKDPGLLNISRKVLLKFPKQTNNQIYLVPGASHFFEEKGKLEEVSKVTVQWFRYLSLGLFDRIKSNMYIKLSLFHSVEYSNLFHLKFANRVAAGDVLSKMLKRYKNNKDVVVIGILRGGIVVSDRVTKNLNLNPTEPVICKRLRSPYDEEETVGAIFQDGSIYLHSSSVLPTSEYLQKEITNRTRELRRFVNIWRIENRKYNFADKCVLLIDDGSYTGATLNLTCQWIKSQLPQNLIVAVPVISDQAYFSLKKSVQEIIYVYKSSHSSTIGRFYQDFSSVQDSEIHRILNTT